MYGESGRYQESEEMFKKAMKINPTYAEAYFNLGNIIKHCIHVLTLAYIHYGCLSIADIELYSVDIIILCLSGFQVNTLNRKSSHYSSTV